MDTTARQPPPTLITLGRTWAGIGLQSFGGGASTQLLIRRAFVEQHPWISADELSHYWNLCQFAPGINLIALTILIGRKLGGAAGIVVSLAGMLVPSAGLTCILTAGFEAVRTSPILHAILQGVIPATGGIMAVVMISYARPLLQSADHRGLRVPFISAVVMVGGALSLILLKLPVSVVLIGESILGVVCFTPWRVATPPEPIPELAGDDQV